MDVKSWDDGSVEGWLDRCEVSRSRNFSIRANEARQWLEVAKRANPDIDICQYDGRIAFKSSLPRLHVIAALYDAAMWLASPIDASEVFVIVGLIGDAIRTMQVVEGWEFPRPIYYFPGIIAID